MIRRLTCEGAVKCNLRDLRREDVLYTLYFIIRQVSENGTTVMSYTRHKYFNGEKYLADRTKRRKWFVK